MTTEELQELFEKHDDEFYLEGRKEGLRALDAFIKLQEIAPVDGDLVSAAEHDEFWLAHEEAVAEKITEDDVIFLLKCGVRYEEGMGFSFFA